MVSYPIHDEDKQGAKNTGEQNERHLWVRVKLRALRPDDHFIPSLYVA